MNRDEKAGDVKTPNKVKTKIRLKLFAAYDYDGIRDEVEKMAKQGWLMEKIGSFYVRHRECPPMDLTCDIVFNRLDCDSEEGMEERNNISSFFEDTGWEEIFTWMQATVFVKEGACNESLYTDEAMKLQGIHTSMKKSYLKHSTGFLIIGQYFLIQNVYRVFFEPHREYYNISGIRILFSLGFIFIVFFSSIIYYYIWRGLSLRAITRGGSCISTRPSSYIKTTVPIVVASGIGYMIVTIPPASLILGITLVAVAVLIALIGVLLYELYLKELETGMPEKKSKVVGTLSAIIMIFIITMMVLAYAFVN